MVEIHLLFDSEGGSGEFVGEGSVHEGEPVVIDFEDFCHLSN